MIQSNICMICRQKNHSSSLDRLRRIKEQFRQPVDMSNIQQEHFTWSIHERCKYGISCNKLQNFENESKRLIKEIEPIIVDICMKQSTNEYHKMLQLLRGEFPAVYNQTERLFRKYNGGTTNG